MRADFKIALDACVLADFGICDLFLRLAEKPRLYLPRWSSQILDEVRRVQLEKFKKPWPEPLADSWRTAVNTAFPEACVDDFHHLIDSLTNDPKDRHVLALAIRSGAEAIVTFNTKDFPQKSLTPWGIYVTHPQDYLLALYSMAPEIVVLKLNEIAQKKGLPLIEVLLPLGKRSRLPNFVRHLIEELGLQA